MLISRKVPRQTSELLMSLGYWRLVDWGLDDNFLKKSIFKPHNPK